MNRSELVFKNNISYTVLGSNQFLFFVRTLPAAENNRSEGTEVAENARNFRAKAAKFEYSFY